MRVAVRYKTNRSDQMTLVNNAFMKIISKIDSFKTGTNYEAWSRKIIQNEIIDDFRKSNRNSHVLYTNNYLNEGESYDNYDLDEKYEEQKILHLLQELPPATRMVFSLFALDDMKSKEISNLLNISSETVKWHLSEARKKLKSELTKINLSENERG